MPESPLAAEILQLLASHSGQPVDYVALFMFLNTVAGGHYEERFTEAELAGALRDLLNSGQIEAWEGDHALSAASAPLAAGHPGCHFRLSGR